MAFLAIIGVVVVLILNSILSGFVLATLWGWFAVPTLHMPPLNIASAIGISMLVGWFLRNVKSDDRFQQYKSSPVVLLVVSFLYDVFVAILTLVMGAIVKSFMQ